MTGEVDVIGEERGGEVGVVQVNGLRDRRVGVEVTVEESHLGRT